MKNLFTIVFVVLIAALLVVFLWWINDRNSYSFFVAGHVYGDANKKSMHVHPPFKDAFPFIRSEPGMSFGILTGDVVKKAQPVYFDTFLSEMGTLGVPYHIAPGNHDVANRPLYESLFGDKQRDNKSYMAFTHENDLFLLLDGNLDEWSITDEQLDFVKETLDFFGPKSRNIFVFVHQLIWWNDKNEFRNITTNWPPNAPKTTNYWTDIEPLIVSLNKQVYLFAGDLGGNQIATPFMYYQKNNLTYVASGMGHEKDDNFLIVHVDKDGVVDLELVALQGEKDRLGKLEDYRLP